MDITRLTRVVAETKGQMESASAALKGVTNAIRNYKTDQIALEKLADDLDAENTNLAAAIVDVNTAPVPVVPVDED